VASDPNTTTTEPAQTYTVRAGSNGEALVTAPSGRMQFLGLWGFCKFAWTAARAGHKVEVKDDR
jgi:hypothetical protein